METNSMAEMVAAVRKHAESHYNEGGWDSVVECMEYEDIERDIGDATTIEDGIRNVGKLCGIWDDRRREVLAEIF